MIESSEGELKRGTIYVTLERMGDKGYVESREESREHPNRNSAPQTFGNRFGRKSLSNKFEGARIFQFRIDLGRSLTMKDENLELIK